MITVSDYQKLSSYTLPEDYKSRDARLIFCLGVIGETGELVDCIKKNLGHGHNDLASKEKMSKEVGDCLWYISALANSCEIEMCKHIRYATPSINNGSVPIDFFSDIKSANYRRDLNNKIANAACIIHSISITATDILNYFLTSPAEILRNEIAAYLEYLYEITATFEIDIDKAAFDNVEKLKARYPNGFSHENSINRKEK